MPNMRRIGENMRGKKVKAIRRASKMPRQAQVRSKMTPTKGGLGKTLVANGLVMKLTRPSGTWQEYWSNLLTFHRSASRLPRGFEKMKPMLGFD
jgi:hypothetical protein